MSALVHQAAAFVSMPSGRGWPPASTTAGTAWKHSASCWWIEPLGVDQDMTRVAVDADESDERNGDAGLFGNFTYNGFVDRFSDLDPASGQLPVAIVDPTDQ